MAKVDKRSEQVNCEIYEEYISLARDRKERLEERFLRLVFVFIELECQNPYWTWLPGEDLNLRPND
jgi:hypothetical protein